MGIETMLVPNVPLTTIINPITGNRGKRDYYADLTIDGRLETSEVATSADVVSSDPTIVEVVSSAVSTQVINGKQPGEIVIIELQAKAEHTRLKFPIIVHYQGDSGTEASITEYVELIATEKQDD